MAIQKIKGIVTDVRKHSDRHNILTLFTREHGRVAFLSAAGNGKSARIRNASLMPLSVISADVTLNSNKELHFLGRFQRDFLWSDIYFSPVKSAIALFMAEFINNYIRYSGPDPRLWDFIVKAVSTLDMRRDGMANFHPAFLLDFMHYAGIRPDLSEWNEDSWFDMREGTVSIFPPSHRDTLNPEQSRILPLIARLNIRTAPVFKMNAAQRRELLAGILKYYSMHFPGISNLKSPEILTDLFS